MKVEVGQQILILISYVQMDLALKYYFSASVLKKINVCQIYLQVLIILDIANAASTHILPEILHGHRSSSRTSTGNPSKADWGLWKVFMKYFSRGNRLVP